MRLRVRNRIALIFAMAMAVVVAGPAQAEPRCPPTAQVETKNYPGAAQIPTHNNLMRPAGKAVDAEGQRLVLRGRVLDVRCRPVPEAVVELWQNNPFGRWLLLNRRDQATPYPTFAGAGRTYTDHEGFFNFITAFPAPLGDRAPFVNIKVISPSFAKPHMTALFFSGDERNDYDEIYRKLSPAAREGVTIHMQGDANSELTGDIEIVLEGVARYRTY